jgi:hypothetical protein
MSETATIRRGMSLGDALIVLAETPEDDPKQPRRPPRRAFRPTIIKPNGATT